MFLFEAKKKIFIIASLISIKFKVMKTKFFIVFLAIFLAQTFNCIYAQEQSTLVQDSVALKETTKEGSDRNVMLNAASNTGPRDVNIGLPANVGGITILENDLPVVYFFWPEFPNRVWRPSVSLENTGLLKMSELANTMGDLGFAVNSYTQKGTKEFQVKGNIQASHYGWFQGDVNISGPISKNGWSYAIGAFTNWDPSTYDLGYADYSDKTQIYRVGITKHFKNNKGDIGFFYKYASSSSISNYAVFEYGKGGKVNELDNFEIGKDSYIVNDGTLRFMNPLNGTYSNLDLDGNKVATESHNFDIFGNYVLNNGWNFKYSARLHSAEASLAYTVPLSVFKADESTGFTYQATGNEYSGNVGSMLAMYTPKTPVFNIAGRFSLSKTIGSHDLTIGLLEQYYDVDEFTSQRSFFYQSVEAQPSKLALSNTGSGVAATDEYGFYSYNVGAEYHNGIENKLSLYVSDHFKVNQRFTLDYGLSLRYSKVKGDYYPNTSRGANLVFNPVEKTYFDHNWLHVAANLQGSYNLTHNFGLLANFLYTETNDRLENYSGAYQPNLDKIRTPMGAFGIFWNTNKFSLVSQATYLTKNNYLSRLNIVNPNDASESQVASVNYDIQTIGWTTDIMAKPFKGLNFHYLITYQDPVYKDYDFSAFGNDYSYSDKNVLEVSKIIMEIDPSYTYKDWRVWASFRYFSKQYANLTNALYFADRWETFGGVNYKLNDHIDLGATVVNFLNQRGAKGTINGAELINDASAYYGQLLTGSYIRPFTVQASVKFHF